MHHFFLKEIRNKSMGVVQTQTKTCETQTKNVFVFSTETIFFHKKIFESMK
jgi:hypothetical protein